MITTKLMLSYQSYQQNIGKQKSQMQLEIMSLESKTDAFNCESTHQSSNNTQDTYLALQQFLNNAKSDELLQSHFTLPDENTLTVDQRTCKAPADNKQRYKKLKQKLIALAEQITDQSFLKENKDFTSPNKSRLMRLAIEFEKIVKTQTKDYQQMEHILKEIQKIIDHKREHDLFILRQTKFIPTMAAFLKQFPCFHKNESNQSLHSVLISLKLLKTFLCLSSNREYFISNNHLGVIVSLLNCWVGKEDKRISIICLYILNSIFSSHTKIYLHQMLEINLEIIFYSQLIRKIKLKIDQCFSDELEDSEFVLMSIKLIYLMFFKFCEREFERATYEDRLYEDNTTKMLKGHFEYLTNSSVDWIVCLVLQKFGDDAYVARGEQIENGTINILFYIFKLLNLIFHVDIKSSQKHLTFSQTTIQAITFIFQYSKACLKESQEIKNLCNEIMIFLANFALENSTNQNLIRTSKLLACICNHPIQYLMDSQLKNILVSCLCPIVHNQGESLKQAFAENSTLPIVKFIEKEMIIRENISRKEQQQFVQLCQLKQCRTLSRKTSVSSISSNYSKSSIAESFSMQNILDKGLKLEMKFRYEYWAQFLKVLRDFDE